MKIINILKQHIYLISGWLVILILLLIVLLTKYDYEQIDKTVLSSDRSCGGPYLEGTYEDAVMKIEGTITEGSIRCYYYHTKDKASWNESDGGIVLERVYEGAEEVNEEIELGTLMRGEWQCICIEKLGEEPVKQCIEITLQGRQYGYQILEEYLRAIIPGLD